MHLIWNNGLETCNAEMFYISVFNQVPSLSLSSLCVCVRVCVRGERWVVGAGGASWFEFTEQLLRKM